MKKFKYPLRITGTTTQIASLFEDLTKLGYTTYHQHLDLEGYNRNVNLVTNDAETNGKLCVYNDGIFDSDIVRTVVPASNKDLVLALAAMVDDDKPHVGEWVVGVRSAWLDYGKMYKIIETCKIYKGELQFNVEGVESSAKGITGLNFCRKATKEEIFAHFDKKEGMFKIGDVVVIENIGFNKELVTPQFGTIDKFEYDKTVVKPTIVPRNLPLGLLWLTNNEFRKATSMEVINYNQEVKTVLDSSVKNPYIEESIVKTRLETLLEDHPDLQEDLAELFPEVIEKPDYRGEVDITDKGVTFNGNPAAWLRGSGNHEGVSLYLCQNYNWEIVTDSEGEQVLLPTHKK
jgi:hypothetical protein